MIGTEPRRKRFIDVRPTPIRKIERESEDLRLPYIAQNKGSQIMQMDFAGGV
jgi:hypothetical protein